MSLTNYSVHHNFILVSVAGNYAAGTVLLQTTAGDFVISTSANRALYNRKSAGLMRTAGDGTRHRAVDVQVNGLIPAALSGVGTGTSDQWVRVSTTGFLERVTTPGGSDDVVGKADGDGNVSCLFGGLANAGGGATPGGSNTQVQFNDSSAFGGDAGLTYNKTTDVLSVTGGVVVGASGFVSIGTNPATTGAVALANNTGIYNRNSTNSLNFCLARLTSANRSIFGDDVSGFGYWDISQVASDAILKVWNGSSYANQLRSDGSLLYAGVPILGDSQPFGCHGRTVKAMADSNQTLSASDYSRNRIKFTGALTVGAKTMTFPHPSSEDRSYTMQIHHAGTGQNIVISTGTGATITMAPGNRATLGFTPDGVIADASFTVA